MSDTPNNFLAGGASALYRVLAGLMGVFMVGGALVFLTLALSSNDWLTLAWVPLCLLNAGGMFGLARTGRWWRFGRLAVR